MAVYNSIYTNPAAYTALQSLNKVNKQLDISQNRVASGMRVASALDNASSFTIAQGLRAEVASIDALQTGLAKAKSIVEYTLAAAEGISDLTGDIRAKLQELASQTLTADQRTAATNDLKLLVSQGKGFARQAGRIDKVESITVDLFSATAAGGTNVPIRTGFIGGVSVAGASAINALVIAKTTTTRMYEMFNSFTGHSAATAAQSALAYTMGQYDIVVANALGTFRGYAKELENQSEFLGKLKATREDVIGAYVDADLATESAKLTALQVQQQLAVQAIGIANQRPQSLLGLFR